MERITLPGENAAIPKNKLIEKDNGYSGEAAERLAVYENMQETMCAKQEQLSKELEKLRVDGKKNTVKFKELMGEKLINTSLLSIYKAYGL